MVHHIYRGVICVTGIKEIILAKLSRIVGFLRLLHEIVYYMSCPELYAVIMLW